MKPLPTAAFGDTGLNVTRLGFGTALAGREKPHWTDETADRQLIDGPGGRTSSFLDRFRTDSSSLPGLTIASRFPIDGSSGQNAFVPTLR